MKLKCSLKNCSFKKVTVHVGFAVQVCMWLPEEKQSTFSYLQNASYFLIDKSICFAVQVHGCRKKNKLESIYFSTYSKICSNVHPDH